MGGGHHSELVSENMICEQVVDQTRSAQEVWLTILLCACRVTDIVADVGRPVRLRFSNKQQGLRERAMPVKIDIPEALQTLTQAQPCEL